MSKYINQVNWPWIKVLYGTNKKTNEPTYQYINAEKIESIDFDSVWYDTGTRTTLGYEAASEIGEFLINRKAPRKVSPLFMDPLLDLAHEAQTMYEWLNENGQA